MNNKMLGERFASGKKLVKCLLVFSLLLAAGCNNIENQGVNTEKAKTNPLIIPPCANK